MTFSASFVSRAGVQAISHCQHSLSVAVFFVICTDLEISLPLYLISSLSVCCFVPDAWGVPG
jgi:hypothetical protein